MSYEGNVADLDLVGRLVDLSREHFTGAIRFENDGIIKIVYFKDGDILSASTNDRTDSIDEMLLRSGKITREHLKQALANRKDSETLGDALLNLGSITRKELTWARRVQVIGIIRSILGWGAGNYTIVSDYLPKREEGTIFPLAQIIIELIVTEPDRARFEKLLDSGNATFEREGDFGGRFQQLGLNQDAEEIAAQIDGAKSAAEIAAITGKDAFNVYKLLYALELLGMLHRVDRSPRPAPAPWSTAAVTLPAPPSDAAAPASTAAPSDLWRSESGSGGLNSGLDAFEASENAPAAATMSSTALSRELTGLEPPPGPSDELLHDPYDPDSVRSQVEENLGGEQAEDGRLRRGWLAALFAILLIAILGGTGYFYRFRERNEPETRPAPSVRIAHQETPAPPPATSTLAESAAQTASASTDSAVSPSSGRTAPPMAAGSGLQSEASGTPAANDASPRFSGASKSTIPDHSGGAAPGPKGTSTAKRNQAHVPSARNRISEGRPAVPEESQTQLEPATATSSARITNIGKGTAKSERRPKPPVTTSSKQSVPSAGSSPSGKDALRARYDSEAARHARSVPAGEPFTVQIELVCRTESLTRALAAGGEGLWFVPTSFRSQPCYRVFWRHFPSAAAARDAVPSIPAALGAGSRPTVTRVP